MHATMSREVLDGLRRKLLDRQRALLAGVDGLEADVRVVEEDRETEVETRAQGEAMVRLLDRVRERDRRELEEVHRALAKIPAGAYGLCESCEEPIAVERLQVLPEARQCHDCALEQESAPAVVARPFAPRAHRSVPADYRDLDDDELAEAVRERIVAHGDPDLASVDVRCHGGVVRLSGEVPSEPQRRVLAQLVADGLGLELLDRLRVRELDRDRAVEAPAETSPPIEERIPAGRGMTPLAAERWTVPDDEGEPPETAPDAPVPEEE